MVMQYRLILSISIATRVDCNDKDNHLAFSDLDRLQNFGVQLVIAVLKSEKGTCRQKSR